MVGISLFLTLAPLVLVWLFRRHKRLIICPNGKPYLTRWSIRKQSTGEGENRAYIHQFHQPDDDYFHNHPWKWSFSLILWGGYREVRLNPATGETTRHYRFPGCINIIRPTDYHIIESFLTKQPVWSLFVCGKHTGNSWGYWDEVRQMHIHWKEHEESK